MTIGARISQLRKEQGLSQEALGEALGVSRQAISKWEADQSTPDVEKLAAISRLFSVSVGWILGTEETRTAGEALTERQLAMIQALIRQAVAQPADTAEEPAEAPDPDNRTPVSEKALRRRVGIVALIALMIATISWGIHILDELAIVRSEQMNFQWEMQSLRSTVGSQLNSVTDRVEEILQAQNSLVAQYEVTETTRDLRAGTITFAVAITPKTYTPGMAVEISADDGSGPKKVQAQEQTGHSFLADVTCTLTDHITLSAAFSSGETTQTQLLETREHLLSQTFPHIYSHLDSRLWADRAMDLFQLQSVSALAEIDNLPEGGAITMLRWIILVNEEEVARVEGVPVEAHMLESLGYYGFEPEDVLPAFAGTLSTQFCGDLQPEDTLTVLLVARDSWDRQYLAWITNFVVGEDSRLDYPSSGVAAAVPAFGYHSDALAGYEQYLPYLQEP